MTYTLKALNDGFPLFINPMVDIDNWGTHVQASVLLTLPEIPHLNLFCTIEYLTPLKYNLSNTSFRPGYQVKSRNDQLPKFQTISRHGSA